MANRDKYVLRVAITLPVKEIYSYSIPAHLLSKANVGCRVTIPFKNQNRVGYILEKSVLSNEQDLKDILDILDPVPLFHDNLVPFFQWMSNYYLYPIGKLIQSALPSGLNVTSFKTGRLTKKGLMALEALPDSSEDKKRLLWIKKNPGKRLLFPFHAIDPFQTRGWVTLERRIRKSPVGPLKRQYIRVKEGIDRRAFLRKNTQSFQAKNEIAFFECLSQSDRVALRDITSRFSNGAYLVNKWIQAGVIERLDVVVIRDPAGKILLPSPLPRRLYEQQERALHTIKGLLDKGKFSACLLHGVTGSGKTEVYYAAAQHAIRLNKQTILIVPEIALAIYMEGIFRSRLGDKVAVFHSALSKGERYDQWMRMANGDVDMVIGARSALFAPLPRLGLIIVDEEYDSSYKQEESPRYQARDAAVVRARIEGAIAVLGSGTPSVQSYHNAMTDRYHHIAMPDRIEKRPLPDIDVVDIKTLPKTNTEEGILSPPLKEAIQQNLTEEKQTILFLNRRGFSKVYLCRTCGESIKCRNCDIGLTYHLKENRLVCHYCNYTAPPPLKCPACGHMEMRAYGFGTEKLEQGLRQIFPGARIGRMDRDSTRRKGQTYQLLKAFSDGEYDILVGTQMITKGYDFPNVTLVGVIAADLSLAFPDFRAGERTFQILSQVAGRAGRGDQGGKVIIQTFNPDHYAIAAAKDHDYLSFFQQEKELREHLGYPPYSFLACLRIQGNSQRSTTTIAQRIGSEMRGVLDRWPIRGKDIHVLGPAEAPLAKLKGKYRCQIIVKSKGTGLLHYYLQEVEAVSKKILRKSGVSLIIDVDPYQML